MAQHHALGPAGGARRINNGGERRRVARNVARGAAVSGQPLLDRFQPRLVGRRRLRFDGQDAHQPAQLIAHGRERFPLLVGAQQQRLAAGVVEYVGDVVAAVLGIKRDDDEPQSQRCLIENHPLRRVAQHDCDTVTRFQTVSFEGRLPARDLAVDLPPGIVAPVGVLLVVVPIRDGFGCAFDARRKQAVECYRFR